MKIGVLLSLIFFCIQGKAQINQQFRGDRITIDTAIVMPVQVYRKIRFKITTADSAILHLENRILNQNKLIDLLQKETRNLIAQTSLQNDFIQSSNQELAEIKRGISELKELPDQKIPFYKQDWFLILAGGLVVVAVVK